MTTPKPLTSSEAHSVINAAQLDLDGWPCGHSQAENGIAYDGCRKCGKTALQFAQEARLLVEAETDFL